MTAIPQNGLTGPSIHLLVVDDEATQMELTKLNLEAINPTLIIKTSQTPSEALTLLKSQRFDCIVTDYQMPKMNGIQLTNEIRKNYDLPIIIYTGHGSEEVASAAFEAGVDDYVRKEGTLAHYHILARSIKRAVENKRSDDALRESEERFRTMANGTPAMLWVTGKNGKNLFVNKYYQDYLKITEQVVGDQWQTYFHKDDLREYLVKYNEALKNQTHFSALARVQREKGGEWRWIETTATPRFSPTGEFMGYIGISTDVTEHVNTVEALRETEERIQLYIQNTQAGILVGDIDGIVTFVNPSMAEMLGYSVDEMIGKNGLEFVADKDLTRAKEIPSKRRSGMLETYKIWMKRKDGSEICTIVNGSPIKDAKGNHIVNLGIISKVTDC